jgi:ATP-dependent Lhr-like helicase
MNLSPFVSDAEARDAYDRLAPEIRRWIREQGWDRLRDVQVAGVSAVLDEDRDVLIAAATAAGKTEAAFLPALTRIAGRTNAGLAVLYVSPLKALINDQFHRLGQLCDRMGIPLVRWHGDAPRGPKTKLLAKPAGIALITPESIEALLIRKPADARRLFGNLDFIIVDELHAFMTGPRGLHLASLLKRIDALASRRPRRVALSATIGDLDAAAAWLHPANPVQVHRLSIDGSGLNLQLQIRGYLEPKAGIVVEPPESVQDAPSSEPACALDAIADHLFVNLRGTNNLVFGGSRRTVEAISDRLRRRAEQEEVPNEFFPHHGNLSKELREELEGRLKVGALPTTAVCTSTLELGIDIGSVRSVAQIGAPRSLSALRQRLGRTGRRQGMPAILRIYVREAECDVRSDLMDELRVDTVRAVAAIRLLGARFVEPPSIQDGALATALLHQTLSVIAERGGARADTLFRLLGGPGPFATVTPDDFIGLLRGTARNDLLEQATDGTLLLGPLGEQTVQSRDFYASFESAAEWRLMAGTRTLGTIPLTNAIAKGNLVVFAGRRWLVEEIDEPAQVLQVSAHQGGVIPKFDRLTVESAHDRLVAEMRQVYAAEDLPPYLDKQAATFLAEGRIAYRRLGLRDTAVLDTGRDVHLFLWRGDAACSVFAAALAMFGLSAEPHDLGVGIQKTTIEGLRSGLARISGLRPGDLDRIGEQVHGIRSAKYDAYVPESLLRRFWVRRHSTILSELASIAAALLVMLDRPR